MAHDKTMNMNGNSSSKIVLYLPLFGLISSTFWFCSGNDGCDLFLTVLTDPKHYLPKCRWILADAAKRGNCVGRVLLVFVKTTSAHVKLDWGIIGSSCERDLFFSGNLPGACQ